MEKPNVSILNYAFSNISNNNGVKSGKCVYCQKRIKGHKGSTGNFNRHFRTSHPYYHKIYMAGNPEEPNAVPGTLNAKQESKAKDNFNKINDKVTIAEVNNDSNKVEVPQDLSGKLK